MNLNKWQVVIPARLHSHRLPRKPLQKLGGKALIVRVFENLRSLQDLGAAICVATDAIEVYQVCEAEDIPVTLSRSDHKSGTDRCAEVAKKLQRPYVMNVQGDEPFVNTKDLLALAKALEEHDSCSMATLRFLCQDNRKLSDPNVVKVVADSQQRALYFSRSPLPFARDGQEDLNFYLHIGIYAFRYDTLQAFCRLKPSSLENCEKLEQLRALEHGIQILLVDAKSHSIGIDTVRDLETANAKFRNN